MNIQEKFITLKDLKQCAICSRRFTSERIKTHEAICQKSAVITRKAYDVSKQRIEDIELEQTDNKVKCKSCEKSNRGPSPLSTNWRSKHESFINTIKTLKMYEREQSDCKRASDLPLSPSLDCSKNIQCPHCLREINEASAERHIATCEKVMKSKDTCI